MFLKSLLQYCHSSVLDLTFIGHICLEIYLFLLDFFKFIGIWVFKVYANGSKVNI